MKALQYKVKDKTSFSKYIKDHKLYEGRRLTQEMIYRLVTLNNHIDHYYNLKPKQVVFLLPYDTLKWSKHKFDKHYVDSGLKKAIAKKTKKIKKAEEKLAEKNSIKKEGSLAKSSHEAKGNNSSKSGGGSANNNGNGSGKGGRSIAQASSESNTTIKSEPVSRKRALTFSLATINRSHGQVAQGIKVVSAFSSPLAAELNWYSELTDNWDYSLFFGIAPQKSGIEDRDGEFIKFDPYMHVGAFSVYKNLGQYTSMFKYVDALIGIERESLPLFSRTSDKELEGVNINFNYLTFGLERGFNLSDFLIYFRGSYSLSLGAAGTESLGSEGASLSSSKISFELETYATSNVSIKAGFHYHSVSEPFSVSSTILKFGLGYAFF